MSRSIYRRQERTNKHNSRNTHIKSHNNTSGRAPKSSHAILESTSQGQHHKPAEVVFFQAPPTRASEKSKGRSLHTRSLIKLSSRAPIWSPASEDRLKKAKSNQPHWEDSYQRPPTRATNKKKSKFTHQVPFFKWCVADLKSVYNLIYFMGGWPPPNPR